MPKAHPYCESLSITSKKSSARSLRLSDLDSSAGFPPGRICANTAAAQTPRPALRRPSAGTSPAATTPFEADEQGVRMSRFGKVPNLYCPQ
jgi:hypothetical protein